MMKVDKDMEMRGFQRLWFSDVWSGDTESTRAFLRVLEHFICGDDIFFYFFKEDGMLLDYARVDADREKIVAGFHRSGELAVRYATDRKGRPIRIDSAIGKLPRGIAFEMMPLLFNFFLETSVFVPTHVDSAWQQFMGMRPLEDPGFAGTVLRAGYADMIVSHVDTCDLLLEFSATKYRASAVHADVVALLGNNLS